MALGVRYYSYPDHSGDGLAALAYVRALHNAGETTYNVIARRFLD